MVLLHNGVGEESSAREKSAADVGTRASSGTTLAVKQGKHTRASLNPPATYLHALHAITPYS